MFDRDFIKEIWHAISQNKVRSTLTAFGVFWGIFMLVTLTGAGNGLQNGLAHQFEGFATNAAFMWTQRTTKPYKGYKKGRNWHFKNSDIKSIKENVPEIEYIVPRLQGWRQRTKNNTVYGENVGTFMPVGAYPELAKIEPFNLKEGRFINEMDIRNNRKVCIIGEQVEEELFKRGENPIGKNIRLAGVYFTIIGTSAKLSNNMNFGYDKRKSIYIPFTTMQSAFNYGDEFEFFSFTAKKENSVAQIEDKVMSILKKRNNIAQDDPQAVGHVNIAKQFEKVDGLFTGINILTLIVGLGTMLAGIIGITNIMLVIVKERTKEIGIRRAIGAKPKDIIVQILTESVFLTLTAGYVGMILGILLNEGLGLALANTENNMFLNPGIDLMYGLKALCILILAGALAGLLPAMKAVKVKPIEAIRYE